MSAWQVWFAESPSNRVDVDASWSQEAIERALATGLGRAYRDLETREVCAAGPDMRRPVRYLIGIDRLGRIRWRGTV